MKIVSPGYRILTPLSRLVKDIYIELACAEDADTELVMCGRMAYQSGDKMDEDSVKAFIAKIMQSKHSKVIEDFMVEVRIICEHGVSHEFFNFRYRQAFSVEDNFYNNPRVKCQKSPRLKKNITVVRPSFLREQSLDYSIWREAMLQNEKAYLRFLKHGYSMQDASSVLPNSLKAEVSAVMPMRAWHDYFETHIIAPDAYGYSHPHPQVRDIMIPLCQDFKSRIPVMFDDILC